MPRDLLAPRAGQVLDALPASGTATAEEIARGACTSREAAEARLLELSSLGFVERVADRWQLCRGGPRHADGADARAGIGT